jgi:hypothetical protein
MIEHRFCDGPQSPAFAFEGDEVSKLSPALTVALRPHGLNDLAL